MTPLTLFWFRRDLRLHDNAGLFEALTGDNPVLGLFIFDSHILNDLEPKDPRIEFIFDSILNIKQDLEKNGSSLLIRTGKPEDIWHDLITEYDIKRVDWNEDYEPYARKRDSHIRSLLEKNDIKVHEHKDQIIFDPQEVLKGDGDPYKVYTPYKNKWKDRLTDADIVSYKSESHLDHFLGTSSLFSPTLEQLGFARTGIKFPKAELPSQIIKSYDQHRDFPGRNGTTRLGIHLRFGTVSIRHCVQTALELNETWLDELVWREFYMSILYHYPHVVDQPFRPEYAQIPWRNDSKEFKAWCEGQTGFLMVDAGMRELNETGYMHNRVRMVTASFLTKHLLIDWRWGEHYFARRLLDYELASNNGNWQWAAGCGVDAAPYFRVFNPDRQIERFDKEKKYIKKWVPEVDSQSYGDPIVSHSAARLRAIETYKKALDRAR
jgi:deoxyribodipyrimidine photo-lyase